SLPEPLVEGLQGVDLILHAGDVNTPEALALFASLAPMRAVVGNNDVAELQRRLPRRRFFRFGRFSAGLMHGHDVEHLTARQAAERELVGRVDLAIFGHSHRALCEWQGRSLLFNPGSPTQKRWERKHSYGIIRVDKSVEPELCYF
ncbi:MAG TPA: YfcE family phosphodiesterase, partial [Thermomicrobiaceae bacterium]|nr:YfcE family phosphodiesterase [Thermomicrobiaceae bacterium]